MFIPSPHNVHAQFSLGTIIHSQNKRGCRLKPLRLLPTTFYICVSCTEQPPLDPKGTIVYESILLQHLLHISTTEAWDVNSRCSDRGVGLLILVAFSFFTFQFLQQFFSRSKEGFVLFSPVTIHFLLDFTSSVTNAPFVGSACEGGQIMERCSFHLVPHFEECSPGVTANCEFNFWELHETFPISTVWLFIIKHTVKFPSVFGGHLASWNTPPR